MAALDPRYTQDGGFDSDWLGAEAIPGGLAASNVDGRPISGSALQVVELPLRRNPPRGIFAIARLWMKNAVRLA